MDELSKLYNKIIQGETVKVSSTTAKARFTVYLALMLMLPAEAQIIFTSGDSYGSNLDRTPPSVPSNLTLTVISKDTIKLNWTDSPEGDLAKIQIRKNNVLIDSVNPGVQQYYASGLTFNTHYYFDLRARDDSSNWSAYCDTVGANTKDTVTTTVPGIPLNFTVTDSTDGVDLSWTSNLPLATHYVIMKDGADCDTTASTTWTDSDTVDGVYHSYAVYGYNGSGDGDTTSTLTAERVSSNTYYVSGGGSNSNSGTNPNLAWKTLSKVNSSWLEGKNVYLKRGETFSGELNISNNNVHVDVYGSGAKPILTQLQSITNSGWSSYATNIYRKAVSVYGIYRIYLSDSLYMPAVELEGQVLQHDATFASLPATNEYYYTGLDRDQRFFYDGTYLYLWAWADPSTAYSSVKLAGLPSNSVDDCNLYLEGDDVTIKNVSFKYGFRGSVINQCNNLLLDSVDFYGHQWHGVYVPMAVTNGNTDNVTIQNCSFDYGLDFYRNADSLLNGWQPYHDNSGSGWLLNKYGIYCDGGIYTNGIAIWFSGDNWVIRNNTFNNYTLSAIEPTISNANTCSDAQIYDNVFTNSSQSGRAINLYDAVGGGVFNLKFFRNKVSGTRINAIQMQGDSVFFYYNLFTDLAVTNPQVYNESGQLWQQLENGIYFWWNTVVNVGKDGFQDFSAKADIRNNILINMGSHASIDYIRNIYYNNGGLLGLYNNTFYAQGKTTSSNLFNINYTGYSFNTVSSVLGAWSNNSLQASATNYLTALLEDATDYKPQDGYTGQASVSQTEFMRWKLGANFQDIFGNQVTEAGGTWSTTIQRGYANEVIP